VLEEKAVMKGTMLIIRPSESHPEAKFYNAPPTLDELRTAIGGGWLELVPYFNTIGVKPPHSNSATVMDCIAFCDEKGKLKHAPFNEDATSAWEQSVRRITGNIAIEDHLRGTVLVLFGDREFMAALKDSDDEPTQ
jgi:hypothetical protein